MEPTLEPDKSSPPCLGRVPAGQNEPTRTGGARGVEACGRRRLAWAVSGLVDSDRGWNDDRPWMRVGGWRLGGFGLAVCGALLVSAGYLAVGGSAAPVELSCPSVAGATLVTDDSGRQVTRDAVGEWRFFCNYEKPPDGVDAGGISVRWSDSRPVGGCPYGTQYEQVEGYNGHGTIVSATHAANADYRWHPQPPGDLPKSSFLGAARVLLAAAESRAASCTAVTSTETATTSAATTTTETTPQACSVVEGRVTDRESNPVRFAHVQLFAAGTVVEEVATGTDGRYRLSVPGGTKEELKVVLLAEEWSHTPSRFRVMFGGKVVGGESGPVVPPGCVQDFPMANLPSSISVLVPVDLPPVFDVYQTLEASWALASRLSPEPTEGLPLPVFVSCKRSSLPFGYCPKEARAHFSANPQPYVALNAEVTNQKPSELAYPVAHEFGHYFMWSAFGATPHFPGDENHAGYYANRSSSDAWVEGFASFYSLMVRREVTREPELTLYDNWGDMERNPLPWLDAGRYEEFAVLGTLLDLADGPGQAGISPERVLNLPIHVSDKRDLFGALLAPDTPAGIPWRAELLDNSGRRLRTIHGAVVEWENTRAIIGALPADVHFRTIKITLRPLGRSGDDDPIDGDLYTLWPALLHFRSTKPAASRSNNHLFDVHDLYRAAQLLHGSDQDRDQNTIPDIDQLFTANGFFSDTNGGQSNKKYDPGETPGLTSHTEATSLDGTTYPAMVPRMSPPLLPELHARINTGAVAATALVQVDLGPRSFAKLITPDPNGLVPLPVPAPGNGGTLTVILLAKDHQPTLALRITPNEFWPDAERNHGHTFLTTNINLQPGDTLLRDKPPLNTQPTTNTNSNSNSNDKGGFPDWAIALIAAAALAAAISLLALRARRRNN